MLSFLLLYPDRYQLMLNFKYTKLDNISPIPIVNLYLRNSNYPTLSICNNCSIVDSGSDLTLISYSDASRLQLEALKTKGYSTFKGLGRIITGAYFLVNVSFDDIKYFRARVLAIPDDDLNGEIIIGRNVLNRYIITLNGQKLTFTISD
jgi:hypothetical protein